MTRANFEQLVKWFQDSGYDVQAEESPSLYIYIEGHGIRAEFSDNPEWGIYSGGRIAADNAGCFDKLSTCPLVMALPVDLEELQKHLTWLASDEGYEWSNSYGYLDDPRLPRDIELPRR